MKSITRLYRLIQINFIFARYGLDQLILSLHLFRPLRFLIYFNPWYWGANRQRSTGERIRLALEALGPIFVKFGQALSTRRDLLPEDIAETIYWVAMRPAHVNINRIEIMPTMQAPAGLAVKRKS